MTVSGELGARLIRAGLVPRAQLADALGTAPPHEGALIAALVARGLREDAVGGFFVVEGYGPMMRRADLAGAEPSALIRLPAGMAHALLALPMMNSPAGLVVAMAAPTDAHAVEELARVSKLSILPTVALLSDLLAALEASYPDAAPANDPARRHQSTQPPVLELVRVRGAGGGGAFEGSTRGREREEARAEVGPSRLTRGRLNPPPGPSSEPARAPGAPLVPGGSVGARPQSSADSGSFVPLVRAKGKAAVKAPPGRARTATVDYSGSSEGSVPPKLSVELEPDDEDGIDVSVDEGWDAEDASAEDSAQNFRARARGTDDPGPGEYGQEAARDGESDRWGDGSDDDDHRIARRRLSELPPGRRARPSRPPPVGQTLAAIRASGDRDSIVTLACQGALTVCRAAVVLAMRKSVLKGSGGAGVSLTPEAVRNLWIPTQSPSNFRAVALKGQPYHGPHGNTAADGLFRAAVASRGGEVALMPVVVGGKLVAVLAADELRFGPLGVERVEVLARAMGDALERLIVSSKR